MQRDGLRASTSRGGGQEQHQGGKRHRGLWHSCHAGSRARFEATSDERGDKVARIEKGVARPIALGPIRWQFRLELATDKYGNEVGTVKLAIKVCVADPRPLQIIDPFTEIVAVDESVAR